MTFLLDGLDDVCAITVSATGTFARMNGIEKWSLDIMGHTGQLERKNIVLSVNDRLSIRCSSSPSPLSFP